MYVENQIKEDMDIIRLRTLTRKSKIGWDKSLYKDNTVQEVLDSNKGMIVWLYYNVEWMNFMEDILEEVGIKGNWVIQKPGTNPKMYEDRKEAKLSYHLVKKFGESKAGFIQQNLKKKIAKKQANRVEWEINSVSKGRMQAVNHGKIKSL